MQLLKLIVIFLVPPYGIVIKLLVGVIVHYDVDAVNVIVFEFNV